LSLKAMSYVSTMRSNLALMGLSSEVPSSVVERCRRDFYSYLEERVLIYPPSMLAVGLRPDMTYQDRRDVLGLKSGGCSLSPDEFELARFLETSSRKARRQAWLWRIGSECEDMRDVGWYPFFVTLTVDPSKVCDSEQFWKEGRAFRKYLRAVAKVSAAAFGTPSAIKEGASDCDFVRHVGVIEHGASHQHHHMHLLLWLRAIPESWKVCPNRSVNRPESRVFQECKPLETLWPWGDPDYCPARYFRHEGDPWSRLGFCVPVDRKTRKPLRINCARAAGTYLAKYMEKGDKAWLHRVKATRDLGKARLRNLLFRIPIRVLEALSWRPRTYSLSVLVQTIHSVPSVLLRSMVKQVLFCRNWDSGCGVPKSWTQASGGVFTAMRESVKAGIKPHRMCLKEFYDWVTQLLPVPDGYCEKRLPSAHLRLRFEFPPTDFKKVEHLGANYA